jgi:branched-chain amino acid transport system substrate-binding protein
MDHTTSAEATNRRRWRLRALASVAAIGLVFGAAACSSDSNSSGTTDSTVSADVLGTPNAASGEAVKVGFISDGRTPSLDNSHMKPAAEATASYINDYMAGIAGRPIQLVACETSGDPGKATDCANQMVQEDVAMVVMPETQQPGAVHTVIAANNIPLFVYGVADKAITEDPNSSFMIVSQTAGLAELPIAVAKENNIDNVTVFVVDVPAATVFYDPGTYGASQFSDAGITLNEIKVPLASADLTQQINQVLKNGNTVLQIVGDPATCIAAINGAKTNGFTGPITILNGCGTAAVKEAVGANMEGVIMASPTPLGDDTNSGIQLWNAILAKYDPSFGDSSLGLTTFITMYSMRQALETISASDITPATVISTTKAAPEQPLVTGDGLDFRCNGKAAPETPAVCTRGALRVAFDAQGDPVLPYTAFGTSPIPG